MNECQRCGLPALDELCQVCFVMLLFSDDFEYEEFMGKYNERRSKREGPSPTRSAKDTDMTNRIEAHPVEKQPELKEIQPVQLKREDRCDMRDCGAQAFVQAVYPEGDILFCGHHFQEHEIEITRQAVVVCDHRDLINQKP